MMRDELKDRAISLLKDTYAIGYEDGVKATSVDCGVVWEERIDAIKAELHEKADFLQTKPEISYDSAFADGLECAVTIIERRLRGENE